MNSRKLLNCKILTGFCQKEQNPLNKLHVPFCPSDLPFIYEQCGHPDRVVSMFVILTFRDEPFQYHGLDLP